MNFSDLYVRLIEDIDYTEIIDFITNQLKPSDVILDAGCGSGVILSPLIQKGYDVTGVDIDEEMLTYAQKAIGQHSKLFVHDLKDPLGLTFDVILMFNDVINYFRGAKTVLKNLKQALKPGGMLLFDFYKVDYLTEMDGYVESEQTPIAYTWKTQTVGHKLTQRIQTNQDHYKVIQYVYEPSYYIEILESLGLKVTLLEGPDERKHYIKATR